MLKAVFASYFERAAHYSSIFFNSVVLDCCLFTGYSEMLESDEIYKISFWLCHVFREERHQCIKQLQQENKKINAWLKATSTFLVQFSAEEMYSVRAKNDRAKGWETSTVSAVHSAFNTHFLSPLPKTKFRTPIVIISPTIQVTYQRSFVKHVWKCTLCLCHNYLSSSSKTVI